jgi:hypothetical protein
MIPLCCGRYSNGLRTGQAGLNSRQCKYFLFFTDSRPTLGPTRPPIQWVPVALSPGVKRQGGEADHKTPFSAEAEKSGAIPLFLPMSSWHSALLIKLGGNLTLPYLIAVLRCP